MFFVGQPNVGCGELASAIGSVAIGDGIGYAAVLPYLPPQGCNTTGNNQTVPVPVFRFNLATLGTPERIETPQTAMFSSSDPLIVAAHGTDGAWAFLNTTAMGSPVNILGSVEATLPGPNIMNMTAAAPAAMVMDGTNTFVIARDTSNPGITTPSYPCCMGGGPASNANAWRIQGTTITYLSAMTAEPFYRDTLTNPLVQNTQSLIFMSRANDPATSQIKVKKVAKADAATATPTEVDTIPLSLVPVGLAADDTGSVVATSTFSRVSLVPSRCTITRYPEGGTKEILVDTGSFSCQDVAIDDTYAYFAIVTTTLSGGEPYGMRGRGIGRVTLAAPHTIETIDLGIDSQSDGPRRIFSVGDSVLAVTPFAIIKLDKVALTDKSDFPP